MDKELDPLRELEQPKEEPVDESRRDLPPTVHFQAGAIRAQLNAQDNAPVETAPAPTKAGTGPIIPPENVSRSGSSDSLGMSRLPSISPSQRTSPSGIRRNGSTMPKLKITENIASPQHIRLIAGVGPVVMLFTLGIVVAVLGIAVMRSGSGGTNPIPRVTPDDPAPFAMPESQSYVEPLFGQFAVKRCSERCSARSFPARDACARGCNMYSLEIYGRRISLDKTDPVADANEIIARCMKKDVDLQQAASGSAWFEEVRDTTRLLEEGQSAARLNEVSRARGLYHKLLDANSRVKTPPGANANEAEFAKGMLRSTCLEANLALTAVAISTAQLSSDQFSQRYYRQIAQTLEPKVIDSAATTINQARSLRLQ